MLYLLLYPLVDHISFFNLFRYITFRSAAATVTALFISLILGPALIRMLVMRQGALTGELPGRTTQEEIMRLAAFAQEARA